jgi:hypothetical protein
MGGTPRYEVIAATLDDAKGRNMTELEYVKELLNIWSEKGYDFYMFDFSADRQTRWLIFTAR